MKYLPVLFMALMASAASASDAVPFTPELVAPLPCDYYTEDDPAGATGIRVNFQDGDIRPELLAGASVELLPQSFNDADGWSAAAPMVLPFREKIDHSRLPSTPEESIRDDAPIRLLDLETGNPTPYVVHIPPRNIIGRDPLETVRLYPFASLVPGRRYVLYSTFDAPLKDKRQKAVRFPLFDLLLSGQEPGDEREKRADEKLGPYVQYLKKAGVEIDSVLIFTGFTVRTRDNAIGALVRAAEKSVAASPPSVKIDKVRKVPAKNHYFVTGVITGPAIIGPRGELQKEHGEIWVDGEMEIPFWLFLPLDRLEKDGGYKAPLIVYCQGGPPAKRSHSRFETNRKRYMDAGFAMIAIDSPSNRYLNKWGNPTRAHTSFPETIRPGMNAAEMAQWAIDIRTVVTVAKTGGFDALPKGAPDGTSEIDPSRIAYTGISYGGINGAVFTALEPRFAAGVLQVGGNQWARLAAEHQFARVFGDGGLYLPSSRPGERPYLLNAAQLALDLVEPSYYAPCLGRGELFGSAESFPVLLQCGVHDKQVLTCDSLAAAAGLVQTPGQPSPEPTPGSRSSKMGGPMYPNGHAVPALKKGARDERFDFIREALAAAQKRGE